ncbi:MAG TPA: tetratricopeptide repeat protein [Candidatus Angelobacter sp.]|nr:tetratricopeptide repeat protein [Candidatus Angelobacter sp.]
MRNFAAIVPFLLILATLTGPLTAQEQSAQQRPSQMVLIMPFENLSGTAGADWIGEAFPEVLSSRLNAAPLFIINRDDRLLAFDRLGLPASAKPSRATIYQVAQELDADYVLMGDFQISSGILTAHARLMDLQHLRLSPEMTESGPLNSLIAVQTALAWDVLSSLKLLYIPSKEQFTGQFPPTRLDALENYTRGVLAASDQEKIRRFQEAVRLEPGNTLATLQLGKTFYITRDYPAAVEWLAKVPPDAINGNEAQFYLGLAAFYAGQLEKSAAAFRALATRLPLTEVYNNLGVVSARLGDKRARDYFEKSVENDPGDPDYHFNLAVVLARESQPQDAARELRVLLALHPDAEAKSFLDAVSASAGAQASPKLPPERIKRNYDESSFRQLALEIENNNEARLAKANAASHVAFHVQRGRELLEQGLTSEAQKEFGEAVALDPNDAGAHAGLARVMEANQGPAGARKEAQASLRLAPSAEAYLVLARLDLAENNPGAAQQNLDRALALDPANAAAVALKHDIAAAIPRQH